MSTELRETKEREQYFNQNTNCRRRDTFVPQGLSFRLMNYGKHKEELQDSPFIRIEDLALVYYQSPGEVTKDSSQVMIRQADLLQWHMTPGQLYRNCLMQMVQNAPAMLCTLDSMIGLAAGTNKAEDQDNSPGMHVLTNQQRQFGAAVILYPGMLRQIAADWNDAFYIIPSSVHELILIPESKMIRPDEMRAIISEVNATELTYDEILSDELYYYNPTLDRFAIARG